MKGERVMGKSIYTYYKERLVEIGGSTRCIYLKNIVRRGAYDLGRIFEGRDAKVSKFVNFLWSASGKYPFTIIGRDERREILENIDIESRIASAQASNRFTSEDADKTSGVKRSDQTRAIENEIAKIKELGREVDEIEKETGRRELFVGYPFVFGSINQGGKSLQIKAPLLLFPVKIEISDDMTAELRFNEREKIHINPALIFAYAQSKRINIDQLELDFDDLKDFRSVSDIIDYLRRAHIRIDCTSSKNVYNYSRFKEPEDKSELSVRYAAVLARFPLSNSIYNDYTALEKQKLTNEAIDELLKPQKAARRAAAASAKAKRSKKAKDTPKTYTVKSLDFAQSEVVRRVDECGNMVVYGPPGTGKSQTIVNIITDSIAKGKSVLVVSQKKAALDVVFNRLGTLNEKCMYITDEIKEKGAFYERCLSSHLKTMGTHTATEAELRTKYGELLEKIRCEENKLNAIHKTLTEKRDFGLSLSEMYVCSSMLNKNSTDYSTYQKLTENRELMSLDYKALDDALFSIKDRAIEKTYYTFMQAKEKNPLLTLTQPDVDIHTINEVKARLELVQKSKRTPFDTAKHPYFRQIMAHYGDLANERVLDSMVKFECKTKYPGKLFCGKERQRIKLEFIETMNAIDEFSKDYTFLHLILNDEGFISVIDNLIRGNNSYIKLVFEAISTYISTRDIATLLGSFDKNSINLLSFAYSLSKNYQSYIDIIDSILPIRIYHEVIYYENACKDDLAKTVDYPSIKSRILKLKEEAEAVAAEITALSGVHEYTELYGRMQNNKDYLYQISKKQKFWPIRKMTEVYGNFLTSLFPCWLLSPENVSSLLPLRKNMFDLVIFDEASQVFIESTIPAIFRGKNIVVAGDSKQLRPSSTFMKRYLGGDPEAQEDLSVQAALEVDSLLDLAVARYESTNLTYHYRSKRSELIDFSNSAFYSSSLQVAPNTSKNTLQKPIERIMVAGSWIERRNVQEADKIVEILSHIFKTRRNNESIGIITFNSEQQSCIADRIDKEMAKNADFRSNILSERCRTENGEDTSLFIKNLENVQGDERDIIIFSIGYARNSEGKVYTSFGSLSAQGGENRLNVAITRAKSKIYVVTSIEPEELKVETSKHNGPRLLKKYLTYVRAVSSGSYDDAKAILTELDSSEKPSTRKMPSERDIAEQIKIRLEKLGYRADTRIGNSKSRISVAVCDEETGKYLVGVELDCDAYALSSSTMERDVYKPRFLESRGWKMVRIWCRDFWLSPSRVVKTIAAIAEENKKS